MIPDRWLCVACVSLGLAVAPGLPAQGPPPGGGGPPGMMNPEQRQEMMLDMLSSEMGLSREQRKQVKGVLDQARVAAKPVSQQLMETRRAIREAVKAGKARPALDPLHKKMGELHTQLAAIESKAYGDICALLKPEQKAESDIAFNMLGMALVERPPMMPGFGPRGGGPRPQGKQ